MVGKVRFRLTESSNYGGLLYRGVGRNLHKSHLQSGGRFYADCPEDASQYGDTVQVVKLSNDASIFKGNSSYKFCKDSGLMDVEYDILSAITYGECSTLRCVDEEFLDDGTDNIHYRAFQCVACEELCEQGYDGAEWKFEDELIPHQFQIWNTDVLINCGTLRSVWENGKERFIAESLVESSTEVDSQGNELTAEQISFFRNSKVRDSNSNLLVVYHGTPHKFDTFDKTKVGSRFTYLMGGGYRPKYTLGFYFTDDKHYASTVGRDGLPNIVKECYLNIENPLVLNVSGWGGSVAYADICHNDIKRWSVGYDGIIINHYDEDDKGFLEDRVIIAFEPNQIKSVTNKSPTESDNLNESVNSKYIRLKLNECVALLEKGDRGMGESTQILCDLLDVVGCRGITKDDAQDYVLHHKDANHKNNRIFNLLLVPKINSPHRKSHKNAYDKTNPNSVKNLKTPIVVPSYSKEVDKGLRGIGAIDVYASLYSGNIVYY